MAVFASFSELPFPTTGAVYLLFICATGTLHKFALSWAIPAGLYGGPLFSRFGSWGALEVLINPLCRSHCPLLGREPRLLSCLTLPTPYLQTKLSEKWLGTSISSLTNPLGLDDCFAWYKLESAGRSRRGSRPCTSDYFRVDSGQRNTLRGSSSDSRERPLGDFDTSSGLQLGGVRLLS